MTTFRPKLWTGVSAAILIGATGVAGCGKHEEAAKPAAGGVEVTPAAATPVAAAAGEAGEAGAQTAYSSVPEDSRTALHLAHLKGFLLAAQAQGGGADAAAVLISQGLSESLDKDLATFKAAGIDEAIVRKAAKTGAEADIKAALADIDAAQAKAGGDKVAVAKGMIEIASGLYQGVVTDGDVDPVEYQHSYGASLSAKQAFEAAAKADPKVRAAAEDMKAFNAMWPSPTPPATPTPAGKVLAQASRVELALS